jgi:hypothetical protein
MKKKVKTLEKLLSGSFNIRICLVWEGGSWSYLESIIVLLCPHSTCWSHKHVKGRVVKGQLLMSTSEASAYLKFCWPRSALLPVGWAVAHLFQRFPTLCT